jgi:hypothetical protein
MILSGLGLMRSPGECDPDWRRGGQTPFCVSIATGRTVLLDVLLPVRLQMRQRLVNGQEGPKKKKHNNSVLNAWKGK